MKKSVRALAFAGCAFALVSGFLMGAEDPTNRAAPNWLMGTASQFRESKDPLAIDSHGYDEKSYLDGENKKIISYYSSHGRTPTIDAYRDFASNGSLESRKAILTWHLVEAMKNGNDPTGLEQCLRWYAPATTIDDTTQNKFGLNQ